MLNKIKAIAGGAAVAVVGGFFAYLGGVDWETAFGPGVAGIILTGLGYAVPESTHLLVEYLRGKGWYKAPEGVE